jgi:hypothetical protein
MDQAKLDLITPTQFQKLLYYANGDTDEAITSNFHRNFTKTSYYVPYEEKLFVVSSIPNEIDKTSTSTYRTNTSFSALLYTNLRVKIPPLKVKDSLKDSVKICWSRYLAHNMIVSSKLSIDGKEYQKIPGKYYDIHYQYEVPNDRKHEYCELVGDVDMLTGWSTHLPFYTIHAPQPFFFSEDISQSLPLSCFGVKEALFEYVFNRNITHFIRVLRLDKTNGKWIEMNTPSLQLLESIVEGLPSQMPEPELWGRYALLSEEEQNERSTCLTSQEYFIHSIIECESQNLVRITDSAETREIKVLSSAPVKKVYWVAENLDAKKKNIHSNYTTDLDTQKGWNPCKKVVFKYGQTVTKSLEQDQFTLIQSYKHCKGSPVDKGYNCYSYANDRDTLNADIGVTFQQSDKSMVITLDDTDPYKVPIHKINNNKQSVDAITSLDDISKLLEEKQEEIQRSQGTFRLHVFLLSYRHVKWTRNDKGVMQLEIWDGLDHQKK